MCRIGTEGAVLQDLRQTTHRPVRREPLIELPLNRFAVPYKPKSKGAVRQRPPLWLVLIREPTQGFRFIHNQSPFSGCRRLSEALEGLDNAQGGDVERFRVSQVLARQPFGWGHRERIVSQGPRDQIGAIWRR